MSATGESRVAPHFRQGFGENQIPHLVAQTATKGGATLRKNPTSLSVLRAGSVANYAPRTGPVAYKLFSL
jgi:hypothetical protein